MVAKLRDTGFLARVLGSSGSGQVLARQLRVAAGALPRAARHRRQRLAHRAVPPWQPRTMRARWPRPCARPARSTARCAAKTSAPRRWSRARCAPRGTAWWTPFREAGVPAGTHLLLVVRPVRGAAFRYGHVAPRDAAAGQAPEHGPNAEAVALREPAAGRARGGRLPDPRRHHDAFRLPRRLCPVPGPARGAERWPVPGAAHDARRTAHGDQRAGRRRRRVDLAGCC